MWCPGDEILTRYFPAASRALGMIMTKLSLAMIAFPVGPYTRFEVLKFHLSTMQIPRFAESTAPLGVTSVAVSARDGVDVSEAQIGRP
jgi:hypothetical protein